MKKSLRLRFMTLLLAFAMCLSLADCQLLAWAQADGAQEEAEWPEGNLPEGELHQEIPDPSSPGDGDDGDGYTESLEPGYYLLVYTSEKDAYASFNNAEQEMRSVRMALSADGKNFETLNNNGGVVFAKEGSKQVAVPKICKIGNEFAVIAPDTDISNGYHIFTSADGVHYYQEALEADAAEYHELPVLKKSEIFLMQEGRDILETDDTVALGNAWELTEEEYAYIVNYLGKVVNTGLEPLADVSVKAGDDIAGILSDTYPSVNAVYSDGSVQSFRIDWTDAAEGLDLSKAGTYMLEGKVLQEKYVNNLKEINGSTLPEDDPENIGDTEPDNYDEETGAVYYDRTKFMAGLPDPYIYYDAISGYYYMTGSYFPQFGDAVDGGDLVELYDRVVLRRGRTLAELRDRSSQVTIWKAGNQGFNDNVGMDGEIGSPYVWAPEIHRVGSKWVIYFAESHDSNNVYGIRCHALVLDGGKDPYETALLSSDGQSQWQDYQMRGRAGNIDAVSNTLCTDMTYFEDEANGQSYCIWAAQEEGTSLYIAKVDKDRPWLLDSELVRLAVPEYGWENVGFCVNDDPAVLQRNGKVFLCYSAAGSGSQHAIGMMSAEQGADLLDVSNWIKNPYPLLTSRDVAGEEGPGIGSFTMDEEGNPILAYYARPTSHNYQHCGWDGEKSLCYNANPLLDPCCYTRLKNVHWTLDGMPILDRTREDELAAENQTVAVKVTLEETAEFTYKILSDRTLEITRYNGTETDLAVPEEIDGKRVTQIGEWAFMNCGSLTSVRLPEGITSVGTQAFINCGSLANITIPQSMALIGGSAFSGCSRLENVYYAGSQSQWQEININVGNGELEGAVINFAISEPDRTPTAILMSAGILKMEIGTQSQLAYTLQPADAAAEVVFTTDDASVAEVDRNSGLVTARGVGSAIVTVSTDGGLQDFCTVIVTTRYPTGDLQEEAPEVSVTSNFGGNGLDEYYAVAQAADGYVAAGYSDSYSFGNGDWDGVKAKGEAGSGFDDAVLVKYNGSGKILWKKNFGGKEGDVFYSVAAAADGYVAAGSSEEESFGNGDWSKVAGKGGQDAVIVKFDTSGNVLWKRNFGGSGDDYFRCVAATGDGYVAVGESEADSFGNGNWSGTYGRGGDDAFIVKYDSDGKLLWKRNFGGTSYDYFKAVAATGDGYVAVGYSFRDTFGTGDWSGTDGKGMDDAVIVKFDTSGNVLWKRNFGGDRSDCFRAVAATEDGGCVAVGESFQVLNGDWQGASGKGSADAIIVKYDASGTVVWKRNFGGSAYEEYDAVAALEDGYIAAGYSNGDSFGAGDWAGTEGKGGTDAIITAYDTSGNILWKDNFGGQDDDCFYAVAALENGCAAAGRSWGDSFGTGDWAGIKKKGSSAATLVRYGKASGGSGEEPTDPEPTDPEPTDPEPTDPDPKPDNRPTKIKLSSTAISLKKGAKKKLTCTFTPSGTSAPVSFISSNNSVATVSGNGTVSAKKKGTATITAKASGLKATCKVTVTEEKKLKAPSLSVKVNSANGVKLSWKKVSGAQGYYVYRATSKYGSFKKIKKLKGTSYVNNKLKSGKTYYYKVAAYKGSKMSANSKTVSRRIIGSMKTPKMKLKPDNAAGKFTISWDVVKGAQKIEILRESGSGVFKVWKIVPANKKRYVGDYKQLKKGVEYRFVVRAYYITDGKKIESKISNAVWFRR